MILKYQTLCDIALQGGDVHWSQTPIANYGGIVAEAERISRPNWWRSGEPHDEQNRAIIRLVEQGQLRDEKPNSERQMTLQRSDDEFEPTETENITNWLARIAIAIGQHPSWNVLQSYASRFRGDANAKRTLDARVVRSFLKNLKNLK